MVIFIFFFERLYREDRALTVRRDAWGFALGLIGTGALYGAYAWIALSTVRGVITLGQMTMYLLLFRQGQAAVSAALSAIGGMYEDNLYLSTLYEYLETEVEPPAGAAEHGPHPEDGIRFERVSFKHAPHKFEAGTPNMAGAIGLAAAMDYLDAIGRDAIFAHDQELAEYTYARLGELPGIRLFGPRTNRGGLVAFALGDVHAHDLVTLADQKAWPARVGGGLCQSGDNT